MAAAPHPPSPSFPPASLRLGSPSLGAPLPLGSAPGAFHGLRTWQNLAQPWSGPDHGRGKQARGAHTPGTSSCSAAFPFTTFLSSFFCRDRRAVRVCRQGQEGSVPQVPSTPGHRTGSHLGVCCIRLARPLHDLLQALQSQRDSHTALATQTCLWCQAESLPGKNLPCPMPGDAPHPHLLPLQPLLLLPLEVLLPLQALPLGLLTRPRLGLFLLCHSRAGMDEMRQGGKGWGRDQGRDCGDVLPG